MPMAAKYSTFWGIGFRQTAVRCAYGAATPASPKRRLRTVAFAAFTLA